MNPIEELEQICEEKKIEVIARNYAIPLLLNDNYVKDVMDKIDNRHKKKEEVSLSLLIQELM